MKNTGTKEKRESIRVALLAAALLAVLVSVLLFTGSTEQEALSGTALRPDGKGEYRPVLFREKNGKVFAACCGEDRSFLLRLSGTGTSAGEIEARRELGFPLEWAGLSKDGLLLRQDLPDKSILLACDAASLTEVSRRELPWTDSELAFFDCDENGAAFAVLSRARKILRISPAEGGEKTVELPESITFLETCGDTLWLCAGSKLYFAGGNAAERGELSEAAWIAPIFGVLDRERFLDADGAVCRLEGTLSSLSVTPLFQCPQLLFDRFSFCLDGENGLIVSSTGGEVYRYALDGEAAESCRLGKTALAVCSAGALVRREGNLEYVPFRFAPFVSDATPSPSPTPEPQAPVRTETIEGTRYILLAEGATVSELRELFKPEAVDIRDLMGRQLLSGKLATGMTAGDWLIVIEGDCNGSGTVNQADLRAALTYCIRFAEGTAALTDPNCRAADVNGDGVVDTADALLLRKRIAP